MQGIPRAFTRFLVGQQYLVDVKIFIIIQISCLRHDVSRTHPTPDPPPFVPEYSTVIDDHDPVDFSERMQQTEKLLSNYVPASRKGDTVHVLRSFLQFLPKRGRLQLMLDIELSASRFVLRDLRDYLYGTLIVPRKYS